MIKRCLLGLLIAVLLGGKAFADCVPSPDTPASVIEYFQKLNRPLPEQFCVEGRRHPSSPPKILPTPMRMSRNRPRSMSPGGPMLPLSPSPPRRRAAAPGIIGACRNAATGTTGAITNAGLGTIGAKPNAAAGTTGVAVYAVHGTASARRKPMAPVPDGRQVGGQAMAPVTGATAMIMTTIMTRTTTAIMTGHHGDHDHDHDQGHHGNHDHDHDQGHHGNHDHDHDQGHRRS